MTIPVDRPEASGFGGCWHSAIGTQVPCPAVPITLQTPHKSVYLISIDHLLSLCIKTIHPFPVPAQDPILAMVPNFSAGDKSFVKIHRLGGMRATIFLPFVIAYASEGGGTFQGLEPDWGRDPWTMQ